MMRSPSAVCVFYREEMPHPAHFHTQYFTQTDTDTDTQHTFTLNTLHRAISLHPLTAKGRGKPLTQISLHRGRSGEREENEFECVCVCVFERERESVCACV